MYIKILSAIDVTQLFDIFVYTIDPIHRGPLLREIQYITNRQWTPNLPRAKKKKKNKKTYSMFIVLLNLKQKKN